MAGQNDGVARELMAFIDASPSPWHAVAEMAQRLEAAGYRSLAETARWEVQPGGRYFVVRGGGLIAFAVGAQPLADAGFTLLGAHTDSPGLRLKPHAPHSAEGMWRLGVEVYGGPILATFSDRDFALAGRVHVQGEEGVEARLFHSTAPWVRLANVAIHMNRDVNEKGLCLHKQNELPLLWCRPQPDHSPESYFRSLLAQELDVAPEAILSWELMVCDTQPSQAWGAQQEFIAASRLDNLASCHAALSALLAQEHFERTAIAAFFDHEEVGSESAAGAAGSFVLDTLQRLMGRLGLDEEDRHRALARSFFISADAAHAWHPNFPGAYEPQHRLLVNAGPAIKINANQRYSTGGDTAARFLALCRQAQVPCQQYSHRTDLGCGSTIGPILAARLGIPSVDVGIPLWAMHSVRESVGIHDHAALIQALQQAL